MDCLNFNKKGKLQVLVKCSIKLSCPSETRHHS